LTPREISQLITAQGQFRASQGQISEDVIPLQILLAMVAIGIVAVVALVHLLGHSRPLTLPGKSAARAHWRRHNPDDQIRDITVCHSGHTALVETDHGPGLLWSFGADTVARPLHGATARQTAKGLTIRLPDFAAPRVSLRMDLPEATYWAARITTEAT